MAARPCRTILSAALAAVIVLAQGGCATEKPEMIPVERVVNYSEAADYSRAATRSRYGPLAQPSAAMCREYRERLETYETIYLASLGLGAASVIVGLLTDSETVREIAGVAAATSTLAQAGSSTAHEVTAREAQERGCGVR